MKKLINFLALTALLLCINSCRKNDFSATNPTDNGTTQKVITTMVAGRITDQDGNALIGVKITIGNTSILTNDFGSFIMPKASIGEKVGLIKAEKEGYYAGSRTIIPRAKAINHIEIMLIKKTETGTFTNSNGGSIYLPNNGGQIDFPANSVVTKSGSSFTGKVSVAAFYLNPSDKNLHLYMPGDLRGIATDNSEKYLQTYGMMAVELNDENGNTLQLASGKTAKLTIPITASLQASAPTTIPLWYFDVTNGIWVEQGNATKNGNSYVGNVSHFTFWNADLGLSAVTYEAKFVDANGNPISNAFVAISRTISSNSYSDTRYGYTASDGTLIATVPANETLNMYAGYYNNYSHCWSNGFSQTISPLSANTNGGTFTLTAPTASIFNISGTVVNCNGQNVTDGYLQISIPNYGWWYEYVPNGTFNETIYRCDGVTSFGVNVDVFDVTNNKQNATTITQILNVGNNNLGALAACGKQSFIKYTAILKDQNGNPLTDYYVYLNDINSFGTFANQAHDTITSMLPLNTMVTMNIYKRNSCNNSASIIQTKTIATGSVDINDGIIACTVPTNVNNTITINGVALKCNNQPVDSGQAEFKDANGNLYYANIVNGNYSLVLNRCTDVSPLTIGITLIDSKNYQSNSTPIIIQVTTANVNVGTKQACGITTYIDYTAFFNDKNGIPLSNFYVSINGNYYSPIAGTNQIKLLLKTNQSFLMYVYNYSSCTGYVEVYKNSIGPFTANTNAGIITTTATPTNIITISGTAKDCSNNDVVNGVAYIQCDGQNYQTQVSNGTFSQQIDRCNSTTNTTANIVVNDLTNHQENITPVTANVGTANVSVGSVAACGLNTNVFMNYTLSGNPFNIADSVFSDLSVDSLGNYHTYVSTSYINNQNISFNFIGNQISSYNVIWLSGNYSLNGGASYIGFNTDANNTVLITITEYGAVGQFIAGTFTGSVLNANNVSMSISGSFRVQRKQ